MNQLNAKSDPEIVRVNEQQCSWQKDSDMIVLVKITQLRACTRKLFTEEIYGF
jgi:hypothetical protein